MTPTHPTPTAVTPLAAQQHPAASSDLWAMHTPQPNNTHPAANNATPAMGADQRERVRRAGRIAVLQAELADIAHDRALVTQMRNPRGLLTALDADEHETWEHLAELATSHSTDTTGTERKAA